MTKKHPKASKLLNFKGLVCWCGIEKTENGSTFSIQCGKNPTPRSKSLSSIKSPPENQKRQKSSKRDRNSSRIRNAVLDKISPKDYQDKDLKLNYNVPIAEIDETETENAKISTPHYSQYIHSLQTKRLSNDTLGFSVMSEVVLSGLQVTEVTDSILQNGDIIYSINGKMLSTIGIKTAVQILQDTNQIHYCFKILRINPASIYEVKVCPGENESLGLYLQRPAIENDETMIKVDKINPKSLLGKINRVNTGDTLLAVNGYVFIGKKYLFVQKLLRQMKNQRVTLLFVESSSLPIAESSHTMSSQTKFSTAQSLNPSVRKVKIITPNKESLGLSIIGGEKIMNPFKQPFVTGIFISNITPTSPAEGKISIADEILSINSIQTKGMTHKNFIQHMAQIKNSGNELEFEVSKNLTGYNELSLLASEFKHTVKALIDSDLMDSQNSLEMLDFSMGDVLQPLDNIADMPKNTVRVKNLMTGVSFYIKISLLSKSLVS